MHRGFGTASLAGLCALVAGFASPASAQSAPSPATEGQYAPPAATQDNLQAETQAYEAKGLPLGSFRLFPTLQLAGDYDDNIFRTDTNTKGDFIFLEQPGVTLKSQWSRHELNLYAALAGFQYATHSSENRVDWHAGGNGRLDILRGIDLSGGGSYSVLHEVRFSADQPGGAKSPTRYSLTQADAALNYNPYRFGFRVGGTFAHYDYAATTLISLPPIVIPELFNNDRDRNEYVGFARASFEFSPGYAFFLLFDDKIVRYDNVPDRNGLDRNNHGYSIDGGLDMSLTNLIQGRFFGGYLSQKYHAPLTNVSGFNFGADLTWTPTPLWTVNLTASRTLNGTTINTASAEDDRLVRLTADYSFRRNVLIEGSFAYNDANFRGSARDDKYSLFGIGLKYLMNRYMNAQLRYEHQHRNSTIAGQDFDDNAVTAGLNLQL